MFRRILMLTAFLSALAVSSRAGGPAFIAGSGYDPGVEGMPIVWANGAVQYFTDQGDLSPILTGAQADLMVATAFGAWTGVPGVTLFASLRGHLSEDVNGANIEAGPDGSIAAPADLTPSALGFPIGIVYDFDGSVTDALLGAGAGGIDDCFTNAVYGGPDNFSHSGNIVHAVVVINGICASSSGQLPDVQYRLVRVLGRILGLGWSQANLNVLTGNPSPGSDDFAGFPVMHFADPISCVPITACYPNPAVPKLDDQDALARLYPANPLPESAGRLYGSVYFTDASGNPAQPMQGVNVVARLIDGSGQPSRQFVVTSVSGFAFHGNAGNPINGDLDANGLRFDRWGSKDAALEGAFDLGQLPVPAGKSLAQYQLTVEALDPLWSVGVESYAPTQVAPSGSFIPVVVTVTPGSDVERDIFMLQSAIARAHPGSGSTYTNPAVLPQGGAWGSWLAGYASVDWFEFTAQPSRTASLSVIALDEKNQPTEDKVWPVLGMWQLSDQTGNPAPASTPSAFNTSTFALTRLDAQFTALSAFRIGIADFRGDGRPDYFYRASLLYSDSLIPARLSLAGGAVTLHGIGFKPGLQVQTDTGDAIVLTASASEMEVILPAGSEDGVASLQVKDLSTGGFSQMIGALSYGALSTDHLVMLQGSEPATPIGSTGAYPLRVRAVAADGITPVSGATVSWGATNRLQLSACGQTSFCSVLTDEAGESASWVSPVLTGPSTVTIALAPASYSPAQTQLATVLGTSSAFDLAALAPTRWVGQGATVSVPLTVEALIAGVPQVNVTVNFALSRGTAALSAGSATTNGAGLAGISAQITNQSSDVQISACVAPNNAPCQIFTLFSTPSSFWHLETVSGSLQFVPVGQSFQPLVMRVTDGSNAANPVLGVTVTFDTTLARMNPDPGPPGGDAHDAGEGMPIILGSSEVRIQSTQDGLASLVPGVGNAGVCDVFVAAAAGFSTAQFQMESVAGTMPVPPQHPSPPPPRALRVPNFGFNLAPAALPSAPGEVLFAIPQEIGQQDQVTSQDVPKTDPPQPDVPKTPADDRIACSDSSSGNPGHASGGDSVSARSADCPSRADPPAGETPPAPNQ